MNLKYLPYSLILLFTCLIGVVRYYLIPQWSIPVHVCISIFQFGIFVAFWNFVAYLTKRLHERYPLTANPIKRILIQSGITLLVASPVLIALFTVASFRMPYKPSNELKVLMTTLFILFITLFNFLQYFLFTFNQWQHSIQSNTELQLKTLALEKEKANLQYHQLKNQVNPHFLFNTLSSLDGLIQVNPELASTYLRHLAKVYRYVLEHKENEVVSIATELDFLKHHLSILQMRYDNALQVELSIAPQAADKGIVNAVLQMLIDNAIKHNVVAAATPLQIRIEITETTIAIRNNKQLRTQAESSTRQGLKQLQQLYAFLSTTPVVAVDDANFFTVELPTL